MGSDRNAYEARRKRFKRAYPDKPYDPLWQEPKFKYCKRGKHLMTIENTRIVGSQFDKRCNNCYKAYRRKYQRKYRKMWGIDKVRRIFA